MKPEKMQTIAEVASVPGGKRKAKPEAKGFTAEQNFAPPAPVASLVLYGITDEQIAMLRERFSALTRADDRDSYEAVRLAIGETRDLRVAVEEKRKELKAGALEYGRRVDEVARHYREALEAIEAPLKALKAGEDEKKARAKAEAEAAERARVEAEIKAQREAEDARLRAERAAEEARLAEIRKAEDARLAAEREALAAQQAEVQRQIAEARAVIEQAAKVQAEADRARAEADHAAQIEKARAEAAEQERARIAAEALRVEAERRAEELRAAEHAKLLEKLRPDAQRLADYATALLAVPAPKVRSEQARAALAETLDRLAGISEALTTGFGGAK